ncbi:MAG: DUF2240 family protein [Thermoplasmata archaeon]
MVYELQKIVAFVLKMQGLQEITESDFVNYLSIKKRMLTPSEAKKVLAKCIEKNVVIKEGEMLRPNFDFSQITVPPDFIINFSKLDVEYPDVFSDIVKYIAEKTRKEIKEVTAEVNRIQEQTCTHPCVAALIYAKVLGLDTKIFHEAAEKEIFR